MLYSIIVDKADDFLTRNVNITVRKRRRDYPKRHWRLLGKRRKTNELCFGGLLRKYLGRFKVPFSGFLSHSDRILARFQLGKCLVIMKNVTDFRKTVETCVGPRLSRIQKRLIINLKITCILKETHRTPYWFQYRVILYSDKTANFLRRMQCSNQETRVVWLIQLKQITQCFRSSLLWVWQSITLSSDIFWTPNVYFNEDRMNFKKSTRLEVIL